MRMIINKKAFGKFITMRRKSIPEVHTQSLLAAKLNVAVPTITNIEKGKRSFSFEFFIDLADALLMTPGELMMVLAEREQPKTNYMEMNDWLYEHLAQLMTTYQNLKSPAHQTPPNNNTIFSQKTYEEVAEVDKLTEEESQGKEPENITQTPTETKD